MLKWESGSANGDYALAVAEGHGIIWNVGANHAIRNFCIGGNSPFGQNNKIGCQRSVHKLRVRCGGGNTRHDTWRRFSDKAYCLRPKIVDYAKQTSCSSFGDFVLETIIVQALAQDSSNEVESKWRMNRVAAPDSVTFQSAQRK